MEKQKSNFVNFILVVIALLVGGTFLYDRWGTQVESFDPAVLLADPVPTIQIQPQIQVQPAPQPTPLAVEHPIIEVVATPNSEGMVGYTTEIGGTGVTVYEFLQPQPIIELPTPVPTQPVWALPSLSNLLTSPTAECKPPMACAANP